MNKYVNKFGVGSVYKTIFFPEELYMKIQNMAKESKRSVSSLVVEVLTNIYK
jgi:predicted CopG family antitoxin